MTQGPLEDATFGHAQPLAEAIPGYDTNTANEDTNQATAAAIASQVGVDTPSLDQDSSSTSFSKKCACMVCPGIGVVDFSIDGPFRCQHLGCNYVTFDSKSHKSHAKDHIMQFGAPCRLAGCKVATVAYWWPPACEKRSIHEKAHYRSVPGDKKSSYACAVQNCRFSSKRWSDLRRHTTATHCDNPPKFACSVIGCKYNGEGNGFTRKDKLTDHCRSMHQGQKINGQAVRAIKPAPASSHAEASGSSSISA